MSGVNIKSMKSIFKTRFYASMYFWALGLFLVFLCLLTWTERVGTTTQYGRYNYTEYLVFDVLKWDGGRSRNGGAELCLRPQNKCITSDERMAPIFTEEDKLLAVGQRQHGWVRFFDTSLGLEFDCGEVNLLGGVFRGYWFENRKFVHFLYNDELVVSVFQFDEACRSKVVFRKPIPPYLKRMEVSPYRNGVAWIECENLCSLNWLDRNLNFKKFNYGCTEEARVVIAWRANAPELRQRNGWGSANDVKCLNPDGSQKFPDEPDSR